MSKFGGSRNNKSVPGISSGSLSDIVFMLLFFFMVTTQMRETENKVIVKLPVASEAAKLERKDLSANINIGSPTRQYQAMYGTDARIQLNDSFKTIDDIRDFIASERDAMSEGYRVGCQAGAAPLLRAEDHVRFEKTRRRQIIRTRILQESSLPRAAFLFLPRTVGK